MAVNRFRISLVATCVMLVFASSASAQVFGTFNFQMQPYCNVVTMTITQIPTGFTLDGFDDQCAALKRASLVGMATLNPDGTVGVTFTIVTAPGGKGVHVSAVISPVTGSGTWTDSVANTGTFVLAGAVPGLPPRPLPTSGIGASVITTTEIAAGAVGGSDINTAEVQARVTGTCPVGQAVRSIGSDGTVECQAAGATSVQFRAQDANNLVLAASGSGPLIFAVLSYNVGGGTYTPAAGTYVVPVTGTYHLSASARFEASSVVNGYYCLSVAVGGTSVQFTCAAQTGATFEVPSLNTVRTLTAGQVVTVRALNASTGSQTVSGIGSTSEFTITRLQ